MVFELNTQSSSSSLLFVQTSSSNSNQNSFKRTQIRIKPPTSLSLPHHFKRLEQPRATTCNCIHNEEKEEQGDSIKCSNGLRFVRGKKLLSDLSTWRIGGPCNYFIRVSSQTQLISAIRYCCDRSIRFLIVGKGSNCLFDDYGFDGCVIQNRIEFIERIEPGLYRVGSGYPFNWLGVHCSSKGFTGLEFAGGIPGTVGGAAYMNAGAVGQETADVIDSVEIVTNNGKLQTLNRSDLAFNYRTSSFQDMVDLAAITAITFRLTPWASAREQQQVYLARRRLSQPVGECSAGSVFRNPSSLGISAGELIEKAGLKGFRVRGAKVSEIHANFFINLGSSTSSDMLELINLVKEKVNWKFGIELKEEIRYISPCLTGSTQTEKNFQLQNIDGQVRDSLLNYQPYY